MKKKVLFPVILFLAVFPFLRAQGFVPVRFQAQLDLAEKLLTEQPSLLTLNSWLPEGYKADTLPTFGHKINIRDMTGKTMVAVLNIETFKIAYIVITENKDWARHLHDYLEHKKNFEYVGSEHNCDYLNNKKLSVMICPHSEKLEIHISMYGM